MNENKNAHILNATMKYSLLTESSTFLNLNNSKALQLITSTAINDSIANMITIYCGEKMY